jgi:hypothetical protein
MNIGDVVKAHGQFRVTALRLVPGEGPEVPNEVEVTLEDEEGEFTIDVCLEGAPPLGAILALSFTPTFLPANPGDVPPSLFAR